MTATTTTNPDREYWSVQMSETGPQTLGAFVRERCRANGMTQVELAELAGVGIRLVSELERGKPSIRMGVANQVLAVFGKELGVINGRKEE